LVVPALKDLQGSLRVCASDAYRVLRKTVCGLFTYSLRDFDLLRNGAFWKDTGSFRFLRTTVLGVIFFTRVRRERVMSVLLRTHNLDLILEFQKMMDQGKTSSLQEMVQKAVFFFENQVVNDIKTKEAHNIEKEQELQKITDSSQQELKQCWCWKTNNHMQILQQALPYCRSVFQQCQIQVFQREETRL
jgi:hypothetical protein